jgi:hypothetical protein
VKTVPQRYCDVPSQSGDMNSECVYLDVVMLVGALVRVELELLWVSVVGKIGV